MITTSASGGSLITGNSVMGMREDTMTLLNFGQLSEQGA